MPGSALRRKTFEDQDHNDLHELVRALHAPEFEDVMQYIYEKIDLPSLINYLAVSATHSRSGTTSKRTFTSSTTYAVPVVGTFGLGIKI